MSCGFVSPELDVRAHVCFLEGGCWRNVLALAVERLFTCWSAALQNLCSEDFLKPLEPSDWVSAETGTDKCGRRGLLPLQPLKNVVANYNSAQLQALLWNMALLWDVTVFFVCLQGSENTSQGAAVIVRPAFSVPDSSETSFFC